MANNRKLQQEVDRVLKQIGEHIVEFDVLWEKVKCASTDNLKDKYESDLKKEIKKLQRFRDQIKTWAGSNNEIKNKSPLIEARKNIENKMEHFKLLERESKTKLFSKAGLAAMSRRNSEDEDEQQSNKQRTQDPRAAQLFEWIDQQIAALQEQSDELEKQAEVLHEAKAATQHKGKKGAKSSIDRSATGLVDELSHRLERHDHHRQQLETMKELIDEGKVSIEAFESIKDSIEYYVEENQDPDFQEDEAMYDDLTTAGDDEQDEAEAETNPHSSSDADQQESEDDNDDADDEADASSEDVNTTSGTRGSSSSANNMPAIGTVAAIAASVTAKQRPQLAKQSSASYVNSAQQRNSNTSATAVTATAAAGTDAKAAASRQTVAKSSLSSNASASGPTSATPVAAGRNSSTKTTTASAAASAALTPSAPLVKPMESMASILKKGAEEEQRRLSISAQQQAAAIAQQQQQQQQQQAAQAAAQAQAQAAILQAAQAVSPVVQPQSSGRTSKSQQQQSSAPSSAAPTPSKQPSSRAPPGIVLRTPASSSTRSTGTAAAAAAPSDSSSLGTAEHAESVHSVASSEEAKESLTSATASASHSSSLLPPADQSVANASATATAGSTARNSVDRNSGSASALSSSRNSTSASASGASSDELQYQLSLLSASLSNLPTALDTDRPKQYVPRNPYRTPSYFPAHPAPVFEQESLFSKFTVDTLFFIFYFQQGTPHQYLAARELKKQSWRYHKSYLTWFQRHDDPKETTDEHEQGNYVYFDYEAGWCQRIKADFTFEYKFLET